MSSKKMSVQERIKALNLQQQSGGDGSSISGNTPPRKQTRQPLSPRGGSFNLPSPIRPAMASSYTGPRSPAVVPSKSAQSIADTTTASSYTKPISPAMVSSEPAQPIAAASAASSYSRPSPAVVSSTPMLPEAKNGSPSNSPPSEKAQLFKAAKVIQKSFNAEADILSRSRAARAAASDRISRQGLTKPRPGMDREPLSKQQQQSQHRQSEQQHQPQHQPLQQHQQHDARDYLGSSQNLSSDSDFELDATAALNFWKTQGITNEGPLSYRQAKKRGTAASENIAQRTSVSKIQEGGDDPSPSYYKEANENNVPDYLEERGSSSEKYVEEENVDDSTVDIGSIAPSISTFSQQQDSNTISITSESIPVQGGIHGEAAALSHPQEEEEPKPLSPPDIVRTVNTDSDMEQSYEVEDGNLNERSYQNSRDEYKLEEDQNIVHEEEEYEGVHEQGEQGDVHEQEEEYDSCDQEEQDDHGQKEEQDAYDQHEEQPVFDHHEDQFDYEQQEVQHDYDYDGGPLDNVTVEHSIEVDIIEPQETSRAAEFVSRKTSEDDVLPTSTEESKPSPQSYSCIGNDEAVESDKSILTDLVPITTKHRHGRSKSAGGGAQNRTTYRAYARRSRLRTSPRAPDLTAEMMKDDLSAHSVVSAGSTTYSTSSQTSTTVSLSLSTRATRFLKDKKDKRKQGAPAADEEAATGSEADKAALGQPQPDLAKNIAQNILRGKALKARIKQRRALAFGAAGPSMKIDLQKAGVDVGLKTDSPMSKEAPNIGVRRMAMDTGRPQTIDLKPAIVPKMDHPLSGLNRDEGGQEQQQQHQQWQQHYPAVMDHTTPAIHPSRRDVPPSAQPKQSYESQAGYGSTPCPVTAQQQIPQPQLIPQLQKQQQRGVQDYPKKVAGKGKYFFDHASSMDSGSYSELESKDLFKTADSPQQQRQQQLEESDTAKTKTSSTSFSPSTTSFSPTNQSESGATTLGTNPDVFATFPRGEGKSFDNGCQVFDALNPLIESAFNALNVSTGPGSCGSQSGRPSSASNIFSPSNSVARRVMSNALCNDAPSDEDVAIEVEYVEQGEERSYAETDSIYSMSTRDMYESE